MRFSFALGVLAAALTFADPAAAQDPASFHDQEARALFEAGRTAFRAGRFDAALKHFEGAYELSERPELLYNIGSAADRLRMDARALEAFEQYLEAVPDAPNREEVQSRIRVLTRSADGRQERGADPGGEEAREPSPPAPSPEEAAHAAQPADGAAPMPRDPTTQTDEGSGGIASKWWFWTILGAVVVGAGVGVGVALAGDGDPTSVQGDTGVIHALEGL